jgi:hypothetical protein
MINLSQNVRIWTEFCTRITNPENPGNPGSPQVFRMGKVFFSTVVFDFRKQNR